MPIVMLHLFNELEFLFKCSLWCYLWQQWGRAGYRELRKRGLNRNLARNAAKSMHGPWRLIRSPDLAFALKAPYFSRLRLPQLFEKPT